MPQERSKEERRTRSRSPPRRKKSPPHHSVHLADDAEEADSGVDEEQEEEEGEEEDEDLSDEPTKAPKGKAKNEVPYLKRHLPTKCDWGNADQRGDDKDRYYLADRRTGSAKTDDSDGEISGKGSATSRRSNYHSHSSFRNSPSRRSRTPRSRVRGRSRSRRPRPVIKKVRESGKGKKKGEKQSEKASSKGKGKPKGKYKPVDDDEALSEGTKAFHQNLIDCVPQRYTDAGEWKNHFDKGIDTHGPARSAFLGHVFDHLKDLGKTKNKRIYIGPGRDGSSNDKISIDCKYAPLNTKVSSSKIWKEQGFVKSSYAYFETKAEPTGSPVGDGKWRCIEGGANLDSDVKLVPDQVDGKDHAWPKKLAVLIHPRYRAPILSLIHI